MAATFRYSAEQVAHALRQAGGIQAAAAQALGCERTTIANYARRYETVRAALQESRETLVDVAEGQLRRKVTAGEWPAVHFVLTTLGRARGYEPVSRQEHSGQVGMALGGTVGVEARLSDQSVAAVLAYVAAQRGLLPGRN